MGRIMIVHTRREHGTGIYETMRQAYGVADDEDCDGCMNSEDVSEQIQRFPEGQFVALHNNRVVGMATTMRTNYPPTRRPLRWMEQIGSKALWKHEPNGKWLYGVEMAVRPGFQGRGIGSRLYAARFELVQRLTLAGLYTAGMLMGYYRYRNRMSVRAYAQHVIQREILDPTVSMQMNRGFEPLGIIPNYWDIEEADDTAVLLVWHNPHYQGASL